MQTIDAIIVGHGLAGSVLARSLLKRGKSIMVFDPNRSSTSSKIAAGLVNPVTGRRFVLSWKFETLNGFARSFYRDWEEDSAVNLIYPLDLVRAMEDRRFSDDVSAKTVDPIYSKYLNEFNGDIPTYINSSSVHFQINYAYRVDIKKLIAQSKTQLFKLGALTEEAFDHSRLNLSSEKIIYDNIESSHIFFCEGYNCTKNPWFDYLPFKLTKGEIFELIQESSTDFAYKRDLVLLPIGENRLWCGTLNFWEYSNADPSTQGERILIEKLRKIYNPDPHIHRHLAAIRPTVKDRRPLIGCHPDNDRLVIFNGLGTKGVLLAPYFANELLAHVYEGMPLDKEASIVRFQDLYNKQ